MSDSNETVFDDVPLAVGILALIIGLFCTFFGYRIKNYLLFVMGCLIGLFIGVSIESWVEYKHPELARTWDIDVDFVLVPTLLFGILALLADKLYSSIFGCACGIMIAVVITTYIIDTNDADVQPTLSLVGFSLGITGGVLGTKWKETLIIVFTGLSGAALLVLGTSVIVAHMTGIKSSLHFLMIPFVVLSLIGIMCQLKDQRFAKWSDSTIRVTLSSLEQIKTTSVAMDPEAIDNTGPVISSISQPQSFELPFMKNLLNTEL